METVQHTAVTQLHAQVRGGDGFTSQTVPATKLVSTLTGTFLLTSLHFFCPEATVFKPVQTFCMVF